MHHRLIDHLTNVSFRSTWVEGQSWKATRGAWTLSSALSCPTAATRRSAPPLVCLYDYYESTSNDLLLLRWNLVFLICLSHTAGGLLFTRDSVNLQYTTTAALLLSIYSKALSSVGGQVVQCSAARSFSPDQISSFATSQVKNTQHIQFAALTNFIKLLGFCRIAISDILWVFRWITSWETIPRACRTWSASAPSTQGAFTTAAPPSRRSRLSPGRSLATRASRHGSRPATPTPTPMSAPSSVDLTGTTSSVTTGRTPRTPSQRRTSTQHLWVPVLLPSGSRTSTRSLWTA